MLNTTIMDTPKQKWERIPAADLKAGNIFALKIDPPKVNPHRETKIVTIYKVDEITPEFLYYLAVFNRKPFKKEIEKMGFVYLRK